MRFRLHGRRVSFKLMRILFYTVFAALAVVSAVLLLELSIRLILPVYDPSGMIEFRRDPGGLPLGPKNFSGRQWKNTGDYDVSISINRYGFRDKKDLRDAGKKDIFVVGDSFSFGWGVEEDKRYSNLLEHILGARVYNIAVSAADINDYTRLIEYARSNGAEVKNVIIGICMENDLRDYDEIPSMPRRIGGNSLKPRIPDHAAVKNFLARHSALYHAALGVIHQNEALKKAAMRAGLILDVYYGVGRKEYSEKMMASSVRNLAGLAQNFNIIILIIPSRGLWIGGNEMAESRAHERFIRLLKENNLKTVDLRPLFEENGRPFDYCFKNDGHWNELGHRAAAEMLAKAV